MGYFAISKDAFFSIRIILSQNHKKQQGEIMGVLISFHSLSADYESSLWLGGNIFIKIIILKGEVMARMGREKDGCRDRKERRERKREGGETNTAGEN